MKIQKSVSQDLLNNLTTLKDIINTIYQTDRPDVLELSGVVLLWDQGNECGINALRYYPFMWKS